MAIMGFLSKNVFHITASYTKLIESSGLFPADDFSLEVSSPGLDEPLKLLRQYQEEYRT